MHYLIMLIEVEGNARGKRPPETEISSIIIADLILQKTRISEFKVAKFYTFVSYITKEVV